MNKNRQIKHQQVKEHLKKYGHITVLESLANYGYHRVPTSICILRKEGWEIRTDMKTNPDTGSRYGIFVFISAPEGE